MTIMIYSCRLLCFCPVVLNFVRQTTERKLRERAQILCFPSWRSVSVVPCTLVAAQVLKTNRPSHQKDKFREKGEWVNIVLDSEKDGLSSQTWGKGNKVGGNGDEGLAEAYSKSSDICKREVGSEDSTQALCHSQK